VEQRRSGHCSARQAAQEERQELPLPEELLGRPSVARYLTARAAEPEGSAPLGQLAIQLEQTKLRDAAVAAAAAVAESRSQVATAA
jgi:hypothetical protein